MEKIDIQLGLSFMEREEDSHLEIVTEDEYFFIARGREVEFGEKVFVIQSTPRIRIKYKDVEAINLAFDSSYYWEYKRYLDIVSDAWNRNLGGYLHLETGTDYYDLKPSDLLYYDDKTMKVKLDGEEKVLNYEKDIKDISISMRVG